MTRAVAVYLIGMGAFCVAWWALLWARDRHYQQWQKGGRP